MALVGSADLALETYIMWDLIHDRWHSHGELPFDPFMIRQRLPYWMYSLEELRVDLATYGSAGDLARDGFPFARYVQYAILFDRILRFPITGNRVRNYDGLGGQLLFAFLHQRGVLRWTDNRLPIDWERVEGDVASLRERRGAVPRRHRHEQGVVLGRRARPGPGTSRPTSPRRGRGRRAWSRTRPSRAPGSTACSTTSSRSAPSTSAAEEGGPSRRGSRRMLRPARGADGLFASDNYAGVHPAVLAAIAAANDGFAPAYGDDDWTARLQERMRELFGDVDPFPVFNGTGGNVTALATVMRPFEAVICAETAHINVDECGAPERFAGGKLVDLPTPDGKLTPELVRGRSSASATSTTCRRAWSRSRSRPSSAPSTRRPRPPPWPRPRTRRPAAARRRRPARQRGAALGLGLREITTDCGVDVLTFGGTKNGLLGAEAVVFFRRTSPPLPLRAQAGDAAGLQDALRLGAAAAPPRGRPVARDRRPRQRDGAAARRAVAADAAACASPTRCRPTPCSSPCRRRSPSACSRTTASTTWDEQAGVVRWMCSWQTTPDDVDALVAALRDAAG